MSTPVHRLAALALAAGLACTRANPAFLGPFDDPSSDRVADAAAGRPRTPAQPVDMQTLPRDGAVVMDSREGDMARRDGGPEAGNDPEMGAVGWQGDAAADGVSLDADAAPESSAIDGIVVRYPLDPAPSEEVLDESGGRPGALRGGAAWTDLGFPAARFTNGGALTLDGESGLVTLPAAGLPGLAETKSVSLWFWQAAPAVGLRTTLLALTNPDESTGLQLGLQGGVPSVWLWRQLIGTAVVQGRSPSPSGWTHLALVQDGSAFRLYVDGTLVATANLAMRPVAIASFLLGGYSVTSGEDELWRGRLDDIRIYSGALTPAEVLALASGAR